MSERTLGWNEQSPEDSPMGAVRLLRWIAVAWRPYLGWTVLAVCMGLAMLPVLLLWENRWLRAEPLIVRLYLAGALSVLAVWLIGGWRAPGPATAIRIAIKGFTLILLSIFITSELLATWLPSPLALWGAAFGGSWDGLVGEMAASLNQVGVRYVLWWQGVQNETAGRDDLVFFGFALVVVWLIGLVTAGLARRFRQGLLAAIPVLWVVSLVMLYSAAERWLIVAGVALALLLHLALDQQALIQRWQALRLDYNPLALAERAMLALGVMALIVITAAVMPNLYWLEISGRYYGLIAPFNERLEQLGKRAFPALEGVNPWAMGAAAGGLPNEFLLRAGPSASDRLVMRVRTSESPAFYDAPPPAHAMRGATYSVYDGRGWDNPVMLDSSEHLAEEPWYPLSDTGRRTLLQSVMLTFSGRTIYAAGEPLAPSVAYFSSQRAPGDLVSLSADVGSYTVSSFIPALSEAELIELGGWGGAYTLPEDYAGYLALPDTITPRTKALAAELTAGKATMFEQATAIEQYLRTFPYDLDVPPLPDGIQEVADYFLFDLQRGYCDYYATAFVVLARLSGLPTRFATGFAAGAWNPTEQIWSITEAEAHSWPEVYFPEVGWIPFEPTAGRPELARIGIARGADASAVVSPPPMPASGPQFDDRWLWLVLPAGLAIAGVFVFVRRRRANREDPWDALMRWGGRIGRAPADGETVLEYGAGLAAHVATIREDEPELRRLVSREVVGLSEDVSAFHYAPQPARAALRERVLARWRRLRSYLPRVRR